MLLLALLTHADAFSPAVHRALALRALELESVSVPPGAAPVQPDQAAAFARGAADEDWNIFRKWLVWHHYYTPSFRVRSLWRRPSDERVAMLNGAIDGALDRHDAHRAWFLAGLLAHHVQDMASPPHVVPVAHGLFDAFESAATAARIPSLMGADVPDLDPPDAHRALAVSTLAALDRPIECDAGPVASTTFWAPLAGHFGRVVAPFGRGVGAEGCADGAGAFLLARLDEALAYTRAVVRYVARLD